MPDAASGVESSRSGEPGRARHYGAHWGRPWSESGALSRLRASAAETPSIAELSALSAIDATRELVGAYATNQMREPAQDDRGMQIAMAALTSA